jgi:peroxiredoxin
MQTAFRAVFCLAFALFSLSAYADERGEALLKEVKQEALKMKTFVGKATLVMKTTNLAMRGIPDGLAKIQSEIKIKFPRQYVVKSKSTMYLASSPSKPLKSFMEEWNICQGYITFKYDLLTKQCNTTMMFDENVERSTYLLLPTLLNWQISLKKVNYGGQEVVAGTTYDLLEARAQGMKIRLYISPERRIMRAKMFHKDFGAEVEEFLTEYKIGGKVPDSVFREIPKGVFTITDSTPISHELRPVNSIAPDFSLNVVNGAPFNLNATLKESRLVLVCLSQGNGFRVSVPMKALQRLHEAYQKQGLTTLFYENRESKEMVFKVTKEAGVTFAIAIKEDNKEATVVSQLAHPSETAYFLIGARGKILYCTTDFDEEDFMEEIMKALKKE